MKLAEMPSPATRGHAPSLYRIAQPRLAVLPGTDHPRDCRCGICHCGCGQRTEIAQVTRSARGQRAGEPMRFFSTHGARARRRTAGRFISAGYVHIRTPGRLEAHPKKGHVLEHILVVEQIMGKRLPAGTVVHHVNGDRRDNRPCNLVVCPDHEYHARLHRRQLALEATGNPNALRCRFCGEWDDPAHIVEIGHNRKRYHHRACANAENRARYARKKAEAAS